MQNIVILAVNLGADPETRTTPNDTRITSFRMATSRPRYKEGRVVRDDNGYRVQDMEWHRITCFNGLGRTVADHARKGMLVSVQGRIHNTRWTDSEGDLVLKARDITVTPGTVVDTGTGDLTLHASYQAGNGRDDASASTSQRACRSPRIRSPRPVLAEFALR